MGAKRTGKAPGIQSDGEILGRPMFREKLISTLLWSALSIGAAMLADYVITIALLHDDQGYTPLITLCIATVVTLPTTFALVSGRFNLRKARDELAAARDAAVDANRIKTQFLANMSHDLRTPLNAILGFSELLALDGFAARRVEYAGLIHSSGTHLLDLINDLLDLSRIEAGKLQLHCEPVDMESLAAECAAAVEPRALASNLRLVSEVEPRLPPVIADRRALKQILLNLLANAIKFSRSGGCVELFARLTPDGKLAFGVRDDGVGIAAEDHARVFERFGQVRHDIASAEEGTGLGLPIVKGLAEAHGGSVGLESQAGK
ncbi:MAG TPA: HAMP domain-containing sensor histidine kinase, partial [Rhizomicrobium sp.]|nr:HAMP domain-containing sensor histidine kinase [Rhizomicrobium sp.]